MEHPAMMNKVHACETIIGYQFQDPHICWEALQVAGSGVYRTGGRNIANGNKRLAIVGDAAIDLVLSKDWYESGTDEAQWTTTRLQLSSNENLHSVGLVQNLTGCINTNPLNPVAISKKIMAATVEAVIGAVFLDSGGLAAVKDVMRRLALVYMGPYVLMVMLNMSPPILCELLRVNVTIFLVFDVCKLPRDRKYERRIARRPEGAEQSMAGLDGGCIRVVKFKPSYSQSIPSAEACHGSSAPSSCRAIQRGDVRPASATELDVL